jgi:peptidoglycan/LPS O-acetylase OafA/YrhL
MTEIPRLEFPLKYRSDVDGLRALAVLSVVFYHLGLPLHGGFIGVDIFFTISGFLIGSIILRQTADRIFTFAGFYERRIRRIFPALFVMLLVSFILACKFLLPIELVVFSKSLASASFSVSNIYFWLQSGYFDAPASETPLLHTWSLAIEEQFYVFLPVLLVALHRFTPRRINLVIGLVATASFLISVYGAYRFPSAAFYLLHTRAWELLLGTALALEGFPTISKPVMRHAAGILGLMLIAAALFLYHSWTPFPGLAALPPCLGTALIIAAGESGNNVVGRLLSLKPVVFVGLISYSLYLWHWPLIVFNKFGFTVLDGLDHHQSQVLLFALSFILAVLSWRFVEMPIRRGVWRIDRPALFGGAAVATIVILIGSAVLIALQGVPSRFTQQARNVAAYLDRDPLDDRDQYRNGICFITSEAARLRDFPVGKCLPDVPHEKKLLILGDSHAAAMWWGFEQSFPGVDVMQATASGCKPVLNQRPRQHVGCTEIINYVLREYLPSHRVDAVLIEAHWDDGDLESIGETIAWLHQIRIPTILIGPIVQYDASLPRLLALAISHEDPLLPKRHLEKFVEPLDRQMASLSRDTWHVPYVSMYDLFCSNETCTEYANQGVPLLSDYGHLTKAGSILAARRIDALGVLPVGLKK